MLDGAPKDLLIDPKLQLKPIESRVSLPIGERIIGTIDPRTLSEDEFRHSPGLLFHGAKESVEFDPHRDYSVVSGDYSQTIGSGFYTTDNRDNAAFYSRLRRVGMEPIIVEVMPYQARVLDLRVVDSPDLNAAVPSELFQEYVNFITTMNTQLPKDVNWWLRSQLTEYILTLRRLIREGKPIELRSMLSITGDPYQSEFAGKYFAQFMLGKGFDGLVYNEGGDNPDQKHTTSYVFYNPQKIGTYGTWHQPK